ncbi:hypothetical protein DAI22_05g102800 [Oryza sativa Japonica Group]|nr:hypothetical protein DAI22_05g102800 [Oryza sativa Japonica Group]
MAGVGEVLTSIVLREVARKLGSAARDQVTAQWNFTRDLDGMRTTLESVNALLRLLRDAEQRSALEDVKRRSHASAAAAPESSDLPGVATHFFFFLPRRCRRRLGEIDLHVCSSSNLVIVKQLQQIASPLPTSVRGALVSPSGRPSSTSSSASVLLRRPHRRGPAVVVASTGRRSRPDGQTDGAARLHLWHRSPPATPDSSISSTTVDRGDKLPALLLRRRSSPTTSPVLPAAGTILRRLTGRPPLGRSPCGFGSSASRAAYDISDMLDEFQSIEPDARKDCLGEIPTVQIAPTSHLSTAPSSPPPLSTLKPRHPLPAPKPPSTPNPSCPLPLTRRHTDPSAAIASVLGQIGATAVAAALDCRHSAVVASVVSPPPMTDPRRRLALNRSPTLSSRIRLSPRLLPLRRRRVRRLAATDPRATAVAVVASVISPPPIPAAGSPSTDPHLRRRIRRCPGFTLPPTPSVSWSPPTPSAQISSTPPSGRCRCGSGLRRPASTHCATQPPAFAAPVAWI